MEFKSFKLIDLKNIIFFSYNLSINIHHFIMLEKRAGKSCSLVFKVKEFSTVWPLAMIYNT
jgi:hypothetical protein